MIDWFCCLKFIGKFQYPVGIKARFMVKSPLFFQKPNFQLQAATEAQQGFQAHCSSAKPAYCKTPCWQKLFLKI
jgi:hypothetical protein